MNSLNTEWAISELENFLRLTEQIEVATRGGGFTTTTFRTRGSGPDVVESAEVIEQILARVYASWRNEVPPATRRGDRWSQHREAALRAKTRLTREAELRRNLGDDAPRLAASKFHPWIWDGARALWQSGHFREATAAAARKLNAETQNKLGRRDISETGLFQQAFSLDPPKSDAPRLRVLPDDGSATYKSVQRGCMAYAEGCYAAIRNPVAHVEGELSEDEGLEQLAALSVLARWVDRAAVDRLSA